MNPLTQQLASLRIRDMHQAAARARLARAQSIRQGHNDRRGQRRTRSTR